MQIQKKMTIKDFIIVVLSVVLLTTCLKMCGKIGIDPSTITNSVDTVVVTSIDTVYYPQDTLYIKGETVYVDSPPDSLNYTNLLKYTTSVEDSLIKGYIETTVSGEMVGTPELSYVPKFPKYINRVDSVFTTITKTETLPTKNKLYGGIRAGGNKVQFDIGPTVSLVHKKGFLVGYDYQINQKTHNITAQFEF